MSKELTYDFNIYFGFDKPCCKGVAQGMDSNRLYSQGFLHTLKDWVKGILNNHFTSWSTDHIISLDAIVLLQLL